MYQYVGDVMEPIVWGETLSVGIRELDEQHKKLIGIINRLIEEQKVLTKPETVAALISEMVDYAEIHFRAEEYLMAEYGYEKQDEHIRSHRAFIARTHEFMEAPEGPNILSVSLLEYLKSWLVNHILHEDMEYKPFFLFKGVV